MRATPAPVHGPARRPNTLPHDCGTPPKRAPIGSRSVGEARGGVKDGGRGDAARNRGVFAGEAAAILPDGRSARHAEIYGRSGVCHDNGVIPRECMKDWTLTGGAVRCDA